MGHLVYYNQDFFLYRRGFLENNSDMKIVQTTAECNTDVSISIEVSIFQLSGQKNTSLGDLKI